MSLFKDSMQRGLPSARAHLEAICRELDQITDTYAETDPPGSADWVEAHRELHRLETRTILAMSAVLAAQTDAQNAADPRTQPGLSSVQADLPVVCWEFKKVTDTYPETEPPRIADWFEVRQELVRVRSRAALALGVVSAAETDAIK